MMVIHLHKYVTQQFIHAKNSRYTYIKWLSQITLINGTFKYHNISKELKNKLVKNKSSINSNKARFKLALTKNDDKMRPFYNSNHFIITINYYGGLYNATKLH